MIGTRFAFSIRARGQRPHSEAVYMTAPRSLAEAPRKPLPRGGRPYMVGQWQSLDANERALEKQIVKAARCDREARQLMEAPSVGPIIASMVLAKVSDAKVFRS